MHNKIIFNKRAKKMYSVVFLVICGCLFLMHYGAHTESENLDGAITTRKDLKEALVRGENQSHKIESNFPHSSITEIIRHLHKGSVVASKFARPEDPDCSNFTINLFTSDTFPLVGLASYPGSGNTWLRHLIELSTGIFTGSVYFDVDLLAKGFLGEKEAWNSGSTIVQKLHLKYSRQYAFPKAILLIREPYPAIISFVNFKESGHLGYALKSTFHHEKWPPYVLGQMFGWMSLIISWLESPSQLHIVHYENLLLDLKTEMVQICRFLNVPCDNINSVCFEKHLNGKFLRQSARKPSPQPLDKSVLSKIDAGEDYISDLLIRHGHNPLPTHLYKYRQVSQANRSE